jgi:hypothetical protein
MPVPIPIRSIPIRRIYILKLLLETALIGE